MKTIEKTNCFHPKQLQWTRTTTFQRLWEQPQNPPTLEAFCFLHDFHTCLWKTWFYYGETCINAMKTCKNTHISHSNQNHKKTETSRTAPEPSNPWERVFSQWCSYILMNNICFTLGKRFFFNEYERPRTLQPWNLYLLYGFMHFRKNKVVLLEGTCLLQKVCKPARH